MPLVATDLKFWLSIANPENDTSTSGGIIQDDAHASGGITPIFTDIASAGTVELLSDGADTRTATVTGRLTTGVIDSEAIVLTGATPVAGAKTFERIEKCVLSAISASRIVTLRKFVGSATIATLGTNFIAARRMFYDAASDAVATKTRYELLYIKNTSGTNALLSAVVETLTDTVGKMQFCLAVAKGDTTAVTNRLTAPLSGNLIAAGFQEEGILQSVPTGSLGVGERIGVWLKQSLLAGDAAFKSTYSIKPSGSTS
jgi:hypothetical protein